jgi:hypothetical protein
METLIAIALIESFFINAATALERRRRNILITKWISGNITLEEIKILKKQPWFQQGFKQVTTTPAKKND